MDESDFIQGYINAIFFTDTGDDNQPESDVMLAPETLQLIKNDCRDFIAAAGDLLVDACNRVGYDAERAGHDFWLSRNGHGAGFWCRDELEDGDLGDKLTAIVAWFHGVGLYTGDDGLAYLS